MAASFGIEDGEKCLQSWDIGDRTAILCEYCGMRTTMSPGINKTTDFMVQKIEVRLVWGDFRIALDDAENMSSRATA